LGTRIFWNRSWFGDWDDVPPTWIDHETWTRA
jgi:hypothetical protein